MEVVELVEVSGQTHQVIENFEDLILTVVPEGHEEEAGSAGEGQRTIVVTEVRGPEGMEDQNNKIESLEARVEQLEDQVHFLEDELRIIRRKVVQGNQTNNYSTIRRTVLEVLGKQTMKISLSDFEDEMAESPEPVGRARQSLGNKRRKYENGFSDDDDEDYSEGDEEPPVRSLRRRGPGRPPKSQSGFRKARVHRVELTPPPPKSNRPRGRPRRTVEVNQEEEDVAATPKVEDKTQLSKPSAANDEEFVPENTTVEMETEGEEIAVEGKDAGDEEVEEETGESTTTATNVTKEVTPAEAEEEGPKGTSPRKGRRRGPAEVVVKEAEPTPVRVSTRARKISTRKASD